MKKTINLIHLDDEQFFLKSVKYTLVNQTQEPSYTFAVESFSDLETLTANSTFRAPDIILVDFELSKENRKRVLNGIDAVSILKKRWPSSVFILFSGHKERELFYKASQGEQTVHDFIPKRVSHEDLPSLLISIRDLALEKFNLFNPSTFAAKNLPLVAGTSTISEVNRLSCLIQRGISLLVYGEAGTGKSTLLSCLSCFIPEGDEIHRISGESSLTEAKSIIEMIEERIREAKKPGWLIIDDLHLLKATILTRINRLIPEKPTTSNNNNNCLKIIASSKTELELFEKRESLSPSFLMQMDTQIRLLPLRERSNEIESLIRFKLSQERPHNPPTLVGSVTECLKTYHFRDGNITELFSILKHMLLSQSGNTISMMALPLYIRNQQFKNDFPLKSLQSDINSSIQVEFDEDFKKSFEDYTFEILAQIISKTTKKYIILGETPSVRSLAKLLKISRPTLTRYLHQLKHLNLLSEEDLNAISAKNRS